MLNVLFFFSLFRNRRSGQGDRLSGVSVTLHYGSESEDDPVMSGKEYHFKWNRAIALRLRKWHTHTRHIYPSRLRVPWRRRVRSREFERGREQPSLPAVRGRPRRQEQPGPDLLWPLPAAPLPPGVSRLLSADQAAHLPAADQVSGRSIGLLNRNGHLGRMTGRKTVAKEIHWPRWTLCLCEGQRWRTGSTKVWSRLILISTWCLKTRSGTTCPPQAFTSERSGFSRSCRWQRPLCFSHRNKNCYLCLISKVVEAVFVLVLFCSLFLLLLFFATNYPTARLKQMSCREQ